LGENVPSIFTKIINGELPGHFIWKDDVCVAFLTIAPLQPGHALIVPREEVDSWTELEPDVMKHLTGVAQAIGRALDKAYQPEKVGLVILGLEVRHVHLHVSCIWKPTDLDFGNADPNVPAESVAAEAVVVRKALRELGYEHVVDA
jgi:histidine triad (HIT) family protein